jgi:cap2 methyltransferase
MASAHKPLQKTKLAETEASCWRIPDAGALVLAPAGASADGASAGAPASARFAALSELLSKAKGALDPIPENEYAALAYELDLYARLKQRLRQKYGLPVVTNATLKLYEILSTYPVVPTDAKLPQVSVRAFCNAELPGAFLIALGLYAGRAGALAQKVAPRPVEYEWVASSYAPDSRESAADSSILDDKYGLYAKNRGHWLMGPRPNALPVDWPPVNGDVTDASVVATLADAVHERFATACRVGNESGATLYTSDAGIDVSADYGRQEELTAVLNFGQVICGILALAPGGSFITKQYTFFTEFNRELLTLLSTLFDSLQIIKPLTSRPANSEIYVLGLGFRGIDRALADRLLDLLVEMKSLDSAGPGSAATRCHILASAHLATDARLLEIATTLTESQVAYLREIEEVYDLTQGNLAALRAFTAKASEKAIKKWVLSNPINSDLV